MDHYKPIVMTVLSAPVTATGIYTLLQTATSVFGLITAACGAFMGVCGAIWWFRKLRK